MNLSIKQKQSMKNLIDFVKIEIAHYLERRYDGIKNLRYYVSYDKQTMGLECIFRWGDFSARYVLSIEELVNDYLQYKATERMMEEVSMKFVEMAVNKQNIEAQFTQKD